MGRCKAVKYEGYSRYRHIGRLGAGNPMGWDPGEVYRSGYGELVLYNDFAPEEAYHLKYADQKRLSECMKRNKILLKGKLMKVLPKILRRGIVLWCLYGLARLAILVNPLVLAFGVWVDGYFPNPSSTAESNVGGWLLVIIGLAVLCVVSFAVHKFSTWLFNEKK